jgi:DNA polymerase-4
MIREQIHDELNLTASAGVAPNKFLAKIASDWRKPDGLFVIQPHEIQDFFFHFRWVAFLAWVRSRRAA